jgi:hypothetical protein
MGRILPVIMPKVSRELAKNGSPTDVDGKHVYAGSIRKNQAYNHSNRKNPIH